MIIPVKPDASGNIDIFYEGDENVTQVHFENPDSDFKWALHYLRRGDKRPYNVPLEEADGELIWTVALADTEKPGTGFAQMVGSAEGQTKHSRPYTVTVGKSLGKPGSVPSVEKAFGDAVAADAAAAKRAAEDAEKIYRYVKQGLEDGSFVGPTGPQGPRGEKGPKGEPGPEGPAGKDAPQIDDAVISADSPWSSKKIVETLCPALEETGNPVTCYPVAGYPLGVVASWEPTQAGSGEPSPDNIRPISGRQTVKVERCGENLILYPYQYSLQERNGLVIVPQQDGSVIINGTATADTWYVLEAGLQNRLPLNTVMSLSGCPAGGSTRTGYYIGLYLGGVWYSDSGNGNTNVVCKTRDIISRIELSVIKGTVCKNLTFWPKLEIGDKITPYRKYQGDTLDLQLPGTVYGGSVDAVTGDSTSKWGFVTLDGTEAWTVSGKLLDDKSDWYYISPKIPGAVNDAPKKGNDICSHYPHADVANKNVVKGCAIVWGAIRVRWGDTIPDNADGWKSYLAAQYAAGTPVQIAYKLATHIPIKATGAQPIPALAGCNTILTDADTVTVTGRADPAHAIAALQAQLATATQQLVETQAAVVDTTAMAVDYIYEQDSQIIGGDDDDNQADTEPVDVPGV